MLGKRLKRSGGTSAYPVTMQMRVSLLKPWPVMHERQPLLRRMLWPGRVLERASPRRARPPPARPRHCSRASRHARSSNTPLAASRSMHAQCPVLQRRPHTQPASKSIQPLRRLHLWRARHVVLLLGNTRAALTHAATRRVTCAPATHMSTPPSRGKVPPVRPHETI